MKTRYNTYDIVCCITELQSLIGMRVNNVYDIDNKTYLIKLQRTEEKSVLLLESGSRIHSTVFEWPKNVAPSGFSMKMRKHLKNKRLESLRQLGSDRIVDLAFGTGEATYHVILELYDRGNIVLTDFELVILYVLRPHTEADKFKFSVKEKYPVERVKEHTKVTRDSLIELLSNAKVGDSLKKVLLPHFEFGPSLIEHVLMINSFKNSSVIGKDFDIETDTNKLLVAISQAEDIINKAKETVSHGYIIQKKEERSNSLETTHFYSYQEFHPMHYMQHADKPCKVFDTFNQAVDDFFSSIGTQKIELKALQIEREAMKKLENVKKDHTKRLVDLEKTQEFDVQKAELISRNQQLVDDAILSIQTALAHQITWSDIQLLVKDATSKGDPVAKHIKQLKLEINHISLYLSDPYPEDNSETLPSMTVDIDLDLTAFANARRYYDQKRTAAKKQQKTIESQSKALKSAERKTKQTLKEVQTITNINKARKVYWFEKFFWFISSEGYLVIAGRDQQQNELIVKRYMKTKDVYVHADIHGASSVIIKNPSGLPVSPKTLNEAGTMAICYSVAWEAKVISNAYWVYGEQVTKTAPTGEYLTTGSFMIRGKKNFLPPSQLVLGLSFLFRLEDDSKERHKGERKTITNPDDLIIADENEQSKNDVEIEVLDESDGNDTSEVKLPDETGSTSEEEDCSTFPNTHIKIQHFAGTKVNVTVEPARNDVSVVENEGTVFLGDDKPVLLQPRSRVNSENKSKQRNQVQEPMKTVETDEKKQQTKRGQRSKLKKIKEKYKDQDEEERQLRMDILQSAGIKKETKKKKKGKEQNKRNLMATEFKVVKQMLVKQDIGDVDETEPVVQADVDMLESLTGCPFAEDELLFAIPVVAPYNTLTTYKFKVKLTPGTNRRGKAAKTAVSMFLHDRTTTQREKDLLKAVKDEQLARNIPGKVKLSAPRLQTLKK